MFYPLIRMVPFVGLSIVAIKLSSVVFPEPDAPIIPTKLPWGIRKLTSFTVNTEFLFSCPAFS